MEKTKLSRSHMSSSSAKRIATAELKPGMFLVGVYQSWWNSPFFRHHRVLKQKDIQQLIQSGIKEVMIDPSRGLDVGEPDSESVVMADDDTSETLVPENTAEPPRSDPELSKSEPSKSEPSKSEPSEEARSSEPSSSSQREVACQVRDDAIRSVERVFDGVKTGTAIDHHVLQQTANKLLEEVFTQGDTLAEAVIVQNLKQFDKALYGHVVDVAVLSLLVGIRLNLDDTLLKHLAMGALLHDVGHMRLPKNVLRRKQNLIGNEQRLFERHSELGASILETCSSLSEESRRIVLEHHERQDGSGYPHRLKQDEISHLSDIVGLIDRFDGFVSYWGAPVPVPSALAIRCLYQEANAGKLRLPPVEALIKCLGVYPIGSVVTLTTGEQAIVLRANPQEKLKPVVKVIVDATGKACEAPFVIDLCGPGSPSQDRSITSVLDPSRCKVKVMKYLEAI